MSQQTTIRKLAELVNTPVEKLLEQLAEAGMSFSGPDQVVTSIEKVKLLGFLKRSHGKSESAAEEVVAPGKIVLNRSRKQEITVGGNAKSGRGASTIDVVVRKKVTLNKPGAAGDPDAEMAEIHRKLAESRQRNEAEQIALAAKDRQRAEELAEIKRAAEAAAERTRLAAAEAAGAIATTPLDVGEIIKMQPHQARRKRLVASRIAALTATFQPRPRTDGTGVETAAKLAPFAEQLRSFAGSVRRILADKR